MSTHVQVRAARDRLIDLLGFGQTHPLQDLSVRDEKLKVPFGDPAKVPIDASQADVRYQLRDKDATEDEETVPCDGGQPGTGGTLELTTPPIDEDVTFKIFACKPHSGRWAWLDQTATVKVGLDTALAARILHAPLLDPRIEDPVDTDPRIVDFGTSVTVQVDDAQEGVDYRLVRILADESQETVSVEDVLGLGPDQVIELTTRPMNADLEIRISAIKTFDPALGLPPEEAILDIALPLAVRADTSLTVAIEPAPIRTFGADATTVIAATQPSASYQLYLRTLSDRDFVYIDPGAETLEVPVAGEPTVHVTPPQLLGDGTPAGFAAHGEPQQGDGGELRLTTPALADDSVVIVRANKVHAAGGESSVWLAQAVVALVEPDPDRNLALELPVAASTTTGRVLVTGGQPGVFYHFRRGQTGAERDPPAYFHQLDADDPEQNKGIDQLRIAGDFVLVRDPLPGTISDGRPPPPLLELGSLPLDIALHLRAVKARTRVSVPLNRTAEIPTPPDIHFEEEVIEPGNEARMLVIASRVGEKYQPFLAGEPLKLARHGNGGDLVFLTGPLDQDTTFDMHVMRPEGPGLSVTRVFRLTVRVLAETF